MEALSRSLLTVLTIKASNFNSKLFSPITKKSPQNLSLSTSYSCTSLSRRTLAKPTSKTSSSSNSTPLTATKTNNTHHWVVVMEGPPQGANSKPEIINYYAETLERVLGTEEDAQMRIYNASCDTQFSFCCEIDEEASLKLASLPGVLSVRHDPDYGSVDKDYSSRLSNVSNTQTGSTLLFPVGSSRHWLVRMNKPGVGVVTKAQMVDYYAQILTKVLGNEKDAQMCIYHVSWQSNFGFCCELDEDSARELAGVPGVLSVQPDGNFESENKDYRGENANNPADPLNLAEANQTTPIKTRKLFVTGLSFYTSEKTLRAAFEGFGELVEVKIIMDKISKRSKGYAFVEYTTEEAAAAALKEMNGKIINGWMIVVDVAKSSPPKYSRGRPRPAA